MPQLLPITEVHKWMYYGMILCWGKCSTLTLNTWVMLTEVSPNVSSNGDIYFTLEYNHNVFMYIICTGYWILVSQKQCEIVVLSQMY